MGIKLKMLFNHMKSIFVYPIPMPVCMNWEKENIPGEIWNDFIERKKIIDEWTLSIML